MIMANGARFLLISGLHDHFWHEVLAEALAPLGTVQIGTESDAPALIQRADYDLLIIDATAVESVPLLIARLHAQRQNLRIIVATASPTWKRAREAFQAGAIDYIRKSVNREDIRCAVRAALDKILPPCP